MLFRRRTGINTCDGDSPLSPVFSPRKKKLFSPKKEKNLFFPPAKMAAAPETSP